MTILRDVRIEVLLAINADTDGDDIIERVKEKVHESVEMDTEVWNTRIRVEIGEEYEHGN